MNDKTPPPSDSTPAKDQGAVPAQPVPQKPREIRDQPLHDDVLERAKKLWHDYGQPTGRDDDIWAEAERQILAEACKGSCQVEPKA